MRKSFIGTGVFCLAFGVFPAGSWAQIPVFKIWVTGVYQDNLDGTFTPICGDSCPTQDLPAGIAGPGNLLNIEVTVEGWDADTNSGVCIPTGAACNVATQNCPLKHCTRADGSGGQCTTDADCLSPATCKPDVCAKSPLLGAFQWTIDSSTYSNGGAGPGLALAVLPCTTDADCACTYTEIPGPVNDCADFAIINPGFCTCGGFRSCRDDNTCSPDSSAYMDSSPLTNYIFFSHSALTAIGFSTDDIEFGALSTDPTVGGVPEELFKCAGGSNQGRVCNVDADCPGSTCNLSATSPYYVGTLLLEATDNACGTFTVDLLQEMNNGEPVSTFLRDSSAVALPTPTVESLILDFGSAEPCDDGDPCTLNDRSCGGVCSGTPIVCDPGQTCVGGVCQSECSFADLVDAYWADDDPPSADPFDRPGNCAIDARQPHNLNDANLEEGWDRLILEFNCDDPTGLASTLLLSDFRTRNVPLGLPPSVTAITPNAADHTITVQLSRKIRPLLYTCIKHVDTNTEWCAGYLPADAGQDLLSNSGDIGKLINSINNVPGLVLPEYATDMDRSGLTTPGDILRLIDLLNGAGQFDPWIAKSLPPCPSAP